jgi:U5 small nuclear ribonucleoprotein component
MYRYRVEVEEATAGTWILIGGISESIMKTATVTTISQGEDTYIFRPIRHASRSVVKVAIEPNNPTELPKMLDGLRKINKSYPLAVTKVRT